MAGLIAYQLAVACIATGPPTQSSKSRGKTPLFDDSPFGVHADMTETGVSLWTKSTATSGNAS